MSVIDSLVYTQTNKANCKGQKQFSIFPKKKKKGSAIWRALAKIWWLTDMYVCEYIDIDIDIYIYIYEMGSSYTFLQPLIFITSKGEKNTT